MIPQMSPSCQAKHYTERPSAFLAMIGVREVAVAVVVVVVAVVAVQCVGKRAPIFDKVCTANLPYFFFGGGGGGKLAKNHLHHLGGEGVGAILVIFLILPCTSLGPKMGKMGKISKILLTNTQCYSSRRGSSSSSSSSSRSNSSS